MLLKRFIAVVLCWLVLASVGLAQNRLAVTLQNAATTGNGTVVRLDAPGGVVMDFVIFVDWASGTTAGVITIEEAHDSGYSGTWSSLTTATFLADATEGIHLTGVYRHLRARISTTVVDGTVTVRLLGF